MLVAYTSLPAPPPPVPQHTFFLAPVNSSWQKSTSGGFGRKSSEYDAWHFLIAPVFVSVVLKLEGWEMSHLYMSLLSVLQKVGVIHKIFLNFVVTMKRANTGEMLQQ